MAENVSAHFNPAEYYDPCGRVVMAMARHAQALTLSPGKCWFVGPGRVSMRERVCHRAVAGDAFPLRTLLKIENSPGKTNKRTNKQSNAKSIKKYVLAQSAANEFSLKTWNSFTSLNSYQLINKPMNQLTNKQEET